MNNPLPYYHLGRLFEARGERERAIQTYRTFLMFNDPSFRREAGDARRRLLRFEK
jgi:lipopolysaccharide biosynthesis regulator YciM